MIKYNSRIMEPKNTHHSQLISHHKCKLREKPQCSRGRRTWAAQAPDEHGQCKLQVSLASASSRWAWPAQSKLQEGVEHAPGGHGASSRRAWSKLQEGSKLQEITEKNRGEEVEEKHLHDAQEIPPWHGGAVPVRPRRHQARGSRRRHVDESPSSPSTDLAEDRA
jgi:hypothetical protein